MGGLEVDIFQVSVVSPRGYSGSVLLEGAHSADVSPHQVPLWFFGAFLLPVSSAQGWASKKASAISQWPPPPWASPIPHGWVHTCEHSQVTRLVIQAHSLPSCWQSTCLLSTSPKMYLFSLKPIRQVDQVASPKPDLCSRIPGSVSQAVLHLNNWYQRKMKSHRPWTKLTTMNTLSQEGRK